MKMIISRSGWTICATRRKGMNGAKACNGFSQETLDLMRAHRVPEWFVDSMRKIRCLLPKAHALEYVTLFLKAVWYKEYQPFVFYAAMIRNWGLEVWYYDFSVLEKGVSSVRSLYEEHRREGISNKFEAARLQLLELALECFERGITFVRADINKSDDRLFLPENGQLRLPYNYMDFFFCKTVRQINRERERKPFDSKEDFLNRVSLKDYRNDPTDMKAIDDFLEEQFG